ncbi:hypothetical protein ABW20_dc0101099 [Dactylellina cionopaga]|nr:hypothetical protein ABW20_dc0101099 [Dactylellina cionopaga]
MESLATRTIDENAIGWPFGTNGWKESTTYAAKHTSTVSLVYEPSTIPVPWPWLLFSFAISFLVAGWGYYSTLKQRHEAKGESTRARITLLILLLTTVRSIATFILAVKAYTDPSRYPPVSAIAGLFISALSSALDCGLLPSRFYTSVVKRIAQLNAWMAFAALTMMFVLPFVKSTFLYNRYSFAGGSCPVAVQICPPQPPIVGCPNNASVLSDREKAAFYGALPRDISGLALTATYISPEEIAIAVLAIVVGVYITVSGFRLIGWAQEMFEYVLNYKEEAERKKNRELESNSEELYFVGSLKRKKPAAPIRKDASAFIILSILVFAAVSVPLHAFQQSHPRDIIVVDGFGEESKAKKLSDGPKFREQLVKSYSGENNDGTSWVSCYHITAPASPVGFMNEWTALQQQEPLTFLAML